MVARTPIDSETALKTLSVLPLPAADPRKYNISPTYTASSITLCINIPPTVGSKEGSRGEALPDGIAIEAIAASVRNHSLNKIVFVK
jgi:hypothetical protein